MELDLRTAYMFVGKKSESGDINEMIGDSFSSFRKFNELTDKPLESKSIFIEGIGQYPTDITDCFQDKEKLIGSIYEKIMKQSSYPNLKLNNTNLLVQFGGKSEIVRSKQYEGTDLVCAGTNSVKRSARFVNYLNNSKKSQSEIFGSRGYDQVICAPVKEGMITPESAAAAGLVISYGLQDTVPLLLQSPEENLRELQIFDSTTKENQTYLLRFEGFVASPLTDCRDIKEELESIRMKAIRSV